MNQPPVIVPELPDTIPAPVTYNQVPVYADVNQNIGGFYEALPAGYDSSLKKYPLLIFLHGGGELGNGTTDLPLILKNSIPKLLYHKTFPRSFTVNDSAFSFIIISPQFKIWPVVRDVHAIVQYSMEHYRVDSQRVYIVGISMGGGATWEYAGDYGRSLAAIVPICGASWADSTVAKNIAATGVPSWAFHNLDDSSVKVSSTKRYVNIINSNNPVHPVRLTLWPTGGHDAWSKATDPSYKEDNMNIYEWMLQYTR
jgi:predicted peptidase